MSWGPAVDAGVKQISTAVAEKLAAKLPTPVWTARLVVFAGMAFLLVAPLLTPLNGLEVLSQFLCLLTLALMWNLLAGYTDIMSLGQHLFVGTGAYAFFGLVSLAKINPYFAIPLTGLIAVGFALPVMLVVFRSRAAYLAVGTWVVAEVFLLVAGRLPGFGLGTGISVPLSVARFFGGGASTRVTTIYVIALAVAVAAYLLTWLLLRSRVGIGLTAIRDNEEAASALGVDLIKARMLAFLWTAPFTGMIGAITALQKMRISPQASFGFLDWTVFVIFIVVVGGIGSLEGPILGTIIYIALREYLGDFGTWYLIALGAISIVVMMVEPRGLWAVCRRFLGEDVIPVSHRPDETDRESRPREGDLNREE
jgi:branched-chain amino acid transport system permease protein